MSQANEMFTEERGWESLQEEAPDQYEQSFTEMQVSDIMPSKANVMLLAGRIASQVHNGKVDPVQAAIRLNAMKMMCEEALGAIREDVVDAVEKQGGAAKVYDCKVEKTEVGSKYDYSANPQWRDFAFTEKEAADERKALEGRLKLIPAGKVLVDQETGETLTGPSKSSTTSFKVTLAK